MNVLVTGARKASQTLSFRVLASQLIPSRTQVLSDKNMMYVASWSSRQPSEGGATIMPILQIGTLSQARSRRMTCVKGRMRMEPRVWDSILSSSTASLWHLGTSPCISISVISLTEPHPPSQFMFSLPPLLKSVWTFASASVFHIKGRSLLAGRRVAGLPWCSGSRWMPASCSSVHPLSTLWAGAVDSAGHC